MMQFLLDNSIEIIFSILIIPYLVALAGFISRRKTTATDDFNIMQSYIYLTALRNGKRMRRAGYCQWTHWSKNDPR